MVARWSLAGLVGLGVAGVVGVLAWFLSPTSPGVSAIVFAAAALPSGVGLGATFLVPRKDPTPRLDDSAEVTWLTRALSGMGTDLVTVVGVALAVVSIGRLELPTQLVLLGVLLVALTSAVTRYTVVRSRAIRA